ncbi:MAG TPA: hypothetical protein VJN68_16340, partial [Burkholderiaceae bacterium]|nr:hypothetical protein [Burkholderiaceae bacterium]
MSTLSWTLVIAVTLVALAAQALAMRASHRRALARQQAKHQQQQQALSGQFEQTRKQISQLQSDLANARRELRQLSRKSPTPAPRDTAAAKQALEREIDAASASRHAPPPDG